MSEIKEFCKKLGSTSPTPGGGAAAGISLSMGAACAEKAARFSIKEDTNNLIKSFSDIRNEGLRLSEEDQTAFKKWQEARDLLKKDSGDKKEKEEKVDIYAAECTKVPLSICKNSLKLTELIEKFIPQCSKWLISDASIGASLSNAAFESGIFNIYINIPYVKDKELLKEINSFLDENVKTFTYKTENIIDQCRRVLQK